MHQSSSGRLLLVFISATENDWLHRLVTSGSLKVHRTGSRCSISIFIPVGLAARLE